MGAQQSSNVNLPRQRNGRKWITNRIDQSDDIRDWKLFIDSAYKGVDWSKITSHSELVEYCATQQADLNLALRNYRIAEAPEDCILKLQSMQLAWLYLNSVSTLLSMTGLNQTAWETGVKHPMTLFIKYFQFNPQKLTQFWMTDRQTSASTVNSNIDSVVSFHDSLAWLLDNATKLKPNVKNLMLDSFDASVINLKRQNSKSGTY